MWKLFYQFNKTLLRQHISVIGSFLRYASHAFLVLVKVFKYTNIHLTKFRKFILLSYLIDMTEHNIGIRVQTELHANKNYNINFVN